MDCDHAAIIEALRAAGARFALVHGSRASTLDGVRSGEPGPRPHSDLDVGAW